MARGNGSRREESEDVTKSVVEQVKAMLPTEIEHHVKVHIVFHYVTKHPISGDEIPVEVEPRRISSSR
ncbi:MAG TPA: hypothetical protein VMU25_04810 [Candidatus Paceibacterota bacterium]|nr:hypothetical protein [Candidatus Paceibacterota bacterium]